VQQAVEQCVSLLQRKQHALEVRNDVGDLEMMADGVRLTQIVVNLLTNAGRYMAKGGRAELEVRREGDELVIHVIDDGFGIAPDRLPQIFELFVQVDDVHTQSPEGLGLGLPLVRSLVAMHGGTVEARSEGRGCGSTFTVRLPIRPVTEAVPTPEERVEPATGLDIVVVEDNEDARELLELYLADRGHRVRTAGDGPTGVQLLCESPPDVAFIDIGLPGMTGFDVARRFLERHPKGKTTLVSVSGYGRTHAHELAREAGFDEYVVKPMEPIVLERLLARVMASRRSRGERC
jgi:CheY-like chemotaxis protein/anti-sigma regulatory factor (Ser/Thr protein kinase)